MPFLSDKKNATHGLQFRCCDGDMLYNIEVRLLSCDVPLHAAMFVVTCQLQIDMASGVAFFLSFEGL